MAYRREDGVSESNGKVVYYCEAMKFFGERMIKHFGYHRYDPECDKERPTFFEGLYFPEDYRALMRHRGERMVFWNGTDLTNLLIAPAWQLIMRDYPAKHYCHCVKDQERLASVGVKATVHPLFFGDIDQYPVSYERSNTPQVYLNAHPGREEQYGIPLALAVAKEVPEVKFHIYGLSGQDINNVFYHGWVDESTMDDEIKHFQGCLKVAIDPRASQTLIKSAFMAQYPIASNPLDGVWYAPNKEEIVKCLGLLRDQLFPNYELRDRYLNIYRGQEAF
jgi:hypothetical protein